MFLGKLIKYGLPTSFLYCTVFVQDVWREGEDRLIEEQKRTWKNFFNLVETSYRSVSHAIDINGPPLEPIKNSLIVSKIENIDLKSCWNQKVMSTFKAISSPQATGCKIYRKIQPYFSSNSTPATTSSEQQK